MGDIDPSVDDPTVDKHTVDGDADGLRRLYGKHLKAVKTNCHIIQFVERRILFRFWSGRRKYLGGTIMEPPVQPLSNHRLKAYFSM